ncbi:hypothetical protein F441_12677 [Phytophthora nicotianae CJ01A1]|uniref:Uncharacterized protein n=12 Tax=Phytophthora nicotianae TaxID=4792 RepID=W2PY21_PHYN3|nr:hypothetical protein PPTG_14265 [Phytophthora nicotianae INRA-310]ETI42076.1 hypothetical protein F443_12717 [Phytophthora nicotianae P1569]ETK82118.1 hypothetical protein L915_12437 [Phytophthora nicotianae]ETO70700.1 hypothetical protein F444_12822 [Phytophthora nicotianae P1976]ETP11821.1 hypothetical protein F441_12677 [Phytophthora nicotianae CJ01A1]ETP39976.1 hypothetical protein F442_12623 [Phytophthora nicotianae P10297]
MSVPVVIVDDHHHCLPDIHLAIRQRRLPFSDIHVLHVDAHPDLSFPTTTDTSVIFEPEKLYDKLDESVAGIAEFLLPLVFAGHVNQITWLKPSWATQMPTGAFRQLSIGKRKSNGGMGATSELPHFVEDELYCSVEEIDASSLRTWDLFATEMSSSGSAAAVATEAITTARGNSKAFILDIDLDYFSTWNPFRKDLETHIGEAAVKTVTQVFSSVRYKQEPLDLVTAQQRTSERRVFCELIKHFEASDALEDASKRASEWVQVVKELAPLYIENVDVEKLFDEFIEILEQYRDDKNARHEIWASGPFLDLPHHESSLEEIERMVNELERFLRTHSLDSSNPPAIVAIAKSTGDEFLPPHQLNFVLPNVLRMLERVFGELSIKHVEYEDGGDEDNGANPT